MDYSQSNTQRGAKQFDSNVDLTGKEGYLAKIVNSSGTPKADLPDAAADHTPFLIVDGKAAGVDSKLEPINPEQNCRLKINGTCVPGDHLVREDETGAGAGKVRKLPAGAGTYTSVGIAEESAVDEQLVLARPYRFGDQIVVS